MSGHGPRTTGVHISSGTGAGGVSGELASYVDGMPLDSVEDSEIIAVHGDSPYVVIQTATVIGQEGFSVFVIDDNTLEGLMIRNHTWYGYYISGRPHGPSPVRSRPLSSASDRPAHDAGRGVGAPGATVASWLRTRDRTGEMSP